MADSSDARMARIDERTQNLSMQVALILERIDALPSRFITVDQCELRQGKHGAEMRKNLQPSKLDKAESLAKIFTMMSVAIGILWVVIQHAKP